MARPARTGNREAPPKGRAGERPPAASREASLAALQRSIGNSAFTALVRERAGGPAGGPGGGGADGLAIQRDLVDKAKYHLTVSSFTAFFGATVTEKDAIKALGYLQQISSAGMAAALARLGNLVDVMLGLLPEQHKQGVSYARIMVNLPEPKRTAFLATFPKGEASTAAQKTLLRQMLNECPDSQLAVLKSIMAIRFDMKVGGALTAGAAGETAIEWEPLGLRKMYKVLEALPPAHVAQNAALVSMGRYQGSGVSGYYWKNEAAIGYDVAGLSNTQTSETAGVKDPLHGVNRFDKVVRHEVGHAVDQQTNWSGTHAKEARFGGWTDYANSWSKAFNDMWAASTGGIKDLRKNRQAELAGIFKWVMANQAPDQLNTKITALAWWPRASQNTIDKITGDPIYKALRSAMRDPWYSHENGGEPIDGYIYQRSYTSPQWTRYQASARARKVSQYQFRAPGEWFAEAYAAYYEPNRVKGALLQARDPTAKKWFEDNIDTVQGSR